MFRYFISGGSSGIPKNVKYNSLQWQQIIVDTAYVLREFGVVGGRTVLVAQPSFPWDIGSVFAEACTLCGADVICYGLMAGDDGMIKRWIDLAPDYIISPANLLIKLLKSEDIIEGVFVITAGESFSLESEHKFREAWHPKDVRRIYGLSGLGTIGYQNEPFSVRYRLNPRYHYFIESLKETALQGEGLGHLIIQSRYEDSLVDTGDKVILFNRNEKTGLWHGGPILEIVGRDTVSLLLGDGTYIHESILQCLKDEFSIEELQCEHVVDDEHEYLLFRALGGNQPLGEKRFLMKVSELVPDLELVGDRNRYGLSVRIIVCDISEFRFSTRGKLLTLVPSSPSRLC